MSVTGGCIDTCCDGDDGSGGVTLQQVQDLIDANNALDPPANEAQIRFLIDERTDELNLEELDVVNAGFGSALVAGSTSISKTGGGYLKTVSIRSLNSNDGSLVFENGSESVPQTNIASIRLNNYNGLKRANRVNFNATRWYFPIYVTENPAANPANDKLYILGQDRFQMLEVHVIIGGQSSIIANPVGFYDRVNSMRYEIHRALVGLYERDTLVPETNSPTFARDAYIVNNNVAVERVTNGTTSAPFYGIDVRLIGFDIYYPGPRYQKNAVMIEIDIGGNLPRSEVQVFHRSIPYGFGCE